MAVQMLLLKLWVGRQIEMTNTIIALLTMSYLYGGLPERINHPERYADSSYALYGDVKKKKKKGKKSVDLRGKNLKKAFSLKCLGANNA